MTKKLPETIEFKLAVRQMDSFQRNQIGFLNTIVSSDNMRKHLYAAYVQVVNGGCLVAIELLAEGEKKDIWLTAKDFVNGKLEKDEAAKFAKILYLIEFLLNL
jgi:hypothetical protein